MSPTKAEQHERLSELLDQRDAYRRAFERLEVLVEDLLEVGPAGRGRLERDLRLARQDAEGVS